MLLNVELRGRDHLSRALDHANDYTYWIYPYVFDFIEDFGSVLDLLFSNIYFGANIGAGSTVFNLSKRLNRLNRYEENEASWLTQLRFSIVKDKLKDFKLSLSL